MKIKTERLTIVPLDLSFLDSTCEFALDPGNARYMVFYPKQNREEVISFINSASREWKKEQPDICEFAVIRGRKQIGIITMYFEGDYSRGELGWILRRDCWGKGYAVEAAKGLMDYYREHMGLHRFIAHCDAENFASQRVTEKLGMRLVETHGGRFNRLSDEERQEQLYEIIFE